MKRTYLASLAVAAVTGLALLTTACNGSDDVSAATPPPTHTATDTTAAPVQTDQTTVKPTTATDSVLPSPSLGDISDRGLAASPLEMVFDTAAYNSGCYNQATNDGLTWNEHGHFYDGFTDSPADSGSILLMKAGHFNCYDRLVIDMKTPFQVAAGDSGMLASRLRNMHCFASVCTYSLRVAALVDDPSITQSVGDHPWLHDVSINQSASTATTTTLTITVADDVTSRVSYLTRDREEYLVIDFAPKSVQN